MGTLTRAARFPVLSKLNRQTPLLKIYAKQISFGKSDALVVQVGMHLIQIKTTALEGEPYRNK